MRSERRRQRALERKRRKRQEKHRALARAGEEALPPLALADLDMPNALPEPSLPKMSETLMAFAEPLIATVPADAQAWRVALLAAALVWNAVVAGREEALQKAAQALSEASGVSLEHSRMMAQALADRKREQFAQDTRMIANVQTYDEGDHIHVVAASVLIPG